MKILSLTCAAFLLTSPVVFAEDKAQAQTSTYLEDLQTKLDHMARRANQPSTTGSAVAGLRGSKQEPMSKQLYWKGKPVESTVSIEEVKMFRTAVEEARAGKTENAVTTLKTFLEKYPASNLKPDVQETLKVLAPPAAAV